MGEYMTMDDSNFIGMRLYTLDATRYADAAAEKVMKNDDFRHFCPQLPAASSGGT